MRIKYDERTGGLRLPVFFALVKLSSFGIIKTEYQLQKRKRRKRRYYETTI